MDVEEGMKVSGEVIRGGEEGAVGGGGGWDRECLRGMRGIPTGQQVQLYI